MTEDTVYILLWMLIVATFGFMIGWAGGEELSRRRCAEEKVEELQEQLECTAAPGQEQQLKEIRTLLNDVHELILAVSKGLQKPAS